MLVPPHPGRAPGRRACERARRQPARSRRLSGGKTDPDAHFGAYASEYRRYRPDYPDALFERVREAAGAAGRALDCCTGSGQAALGLARIFDRVVASDASRRQLAHAPRAPGVTYVAAAAEDTPFATASFDLVAVAQALHWLDFERFFAEVRRIVRPGGALAVWCYDLARTSPSVDAVVDRLYGDVLRGFWLPARRHVEAAYRTIPVPFAPIEVVRFRMRKSWTLDDLLGYLGTWSASRIYTERRGGEPVAALERELREAWGPTGRSREVTWPITLRTFRVA